MEGFKWRNPSNCAYPAPNRAVSFLLGVENILKKQGQTYREIGSETCFS